MLPTEQMTHPSEVQSVLNAGRRHSSVERPSVVLRPTDWEYAPGDSTLGLTVPSTAMPEKRKSITIRHRVLTPRTPMWYVRNVPVDTPLVMRVAADDGAQVYVDGERLYQVRPETYRLAPAPGPREVRIRVLNNAVFGGLNSVRFYRASDYEAYRSALRLRGRLDTLVSKLAHWREPEPEVVRAVQSAVKNPTPATISSAEDAFCSWPWITAGPILQEPGPRRMTVLWETDCSATAYVRWGRSPDSLRHRVPAIKTAGAYEASLAHLPPDTTIHYRVYTRQSRSARHAFKTQAEPSPGGHPGDFRFTAWGDSQNGWGVFRQVVHAMRSEPQVFSIGIGDYVSDGSDARSWRQFMNILYPLASQVPVHLIPGNHDYDGFYDDLHPRHFARYARNGEHLNYKAWTYGNARFVAIDPNENFPVHIEAGSEQHRWLMNQLRSDAWTKATWRFLLVHQPPYAEMSAVWNGQPTVRALLDTLAVETEIDVVLSGHNHDYERWSRTVEGHTTHYLTLGGAGGPLTASERTDWPRVDVTALRHHYGMFHVRGDTLQFKAIPADQGTPLDTFIAVK
jgi:hypothetical protein